MIRLGISFLIFLLIFSLVYSREHSNALIIDHTCTELSKIPDQWLDSIKIKFRVYLAHTSHGEQITIGLQRLGNRNKKYLVNINNNGLTIKPNTLNLLDNKEADPEDYWNSNEWENGMKKTRQILHSHPEINVSMYIGCIELYSMGVDYVQAYLDSIGKLESEFPNVTFIYSTAHAQYLWDPQYQIDGYNRHLRNEQIRQYCQNQNKVLFDFGDLDSWWLDPETKKWLSKPSILKGYKVPMQHPHFDGDEAGHTTFESCEQKARAFWWMLARLAGWQAIK